MNTQAGSATALPTLPEWQESDSTRQARLQWLRRQGWRAASYADWQPAAYCTWPRAATAAPLVEAEHAAAVKRSSHVARGWRWHPHWTITDCHSVGAAAYRLPQAGAAMLTPFAAAMLDACQWLRRWSRLPDAAAPLPQADGTRLPIIGCHCRVCLLPEAASASQPLDRW